MFLKDPSNYCTENRLFLIRQERETEMVMGEKIKRIGTFYVGDAYEITKRSLKPWGWNWIELFRERESLRQQ